MGAAPGLSPTMAVALLISFTFKMSPEQDLIMLGASKHSKIINKKVISVISRVIGIILAGLSIQYILDGIKNYLT